MLVLYMLIQFLLVGFFVCFNFLGDHRRSAVPYLGLEVPPAFHRNQSRRAGKASFLAAEGLCETRGCQGPELSPGGQLLQGEPLALATVRLTSQVVFLK